MKSILHIVPFLAALVLLSCGGEAPGTGTESPEAPAPLRLPEAYYGTWELTGSSGGIHGRGDQAPEGVRLVIGADHVAERQAPGKPDVRGAFTVRRGPTIFTTEPGWHIEADDLALSGVVEVAGDGENLTISENHPDGFNWHYRRVE